MLITDDMMDDDPDNINIMEDSIIQLAIEDHLKELGYEIEHYCWFTNVKLYDTPFYQVHYYDTGIMFNILGHNHLFDTYFVAYYQPDFFECIVKFIRANYPVFEAPCL